MSEQTCQVTVISQDEISHAGTLRPRLDSSFKLMDSIILELENRRCDAAKTNDMLLRDDGFELFEEDVADEHLICQAIIALDDIQSRLKSISALSAIPTTLASTIPAIRILSSSLFELVPEPSQKLCELSVNLGSIAMDSAILTNARCDFGLSNVESNRLLDEAKLMADSKIDKRYPNLETAKTDST